MFESLRSVVSPSKKTVVQIFSDFNNLAVFTNVVTAISAGSSNECDIYLNFFVYQCFSFVVRTVKSYPTEVKKAKIANTKSPK